MASIFATNLLWMKQEGVVPDRDIIMALTADEAAVQTARACSRHSTKT